METSQPVIRYLMNDPTTPELVKDVAVPELLETDPAFSVIGYEGGGFPPSSRQGQAANVYYNVLSTLRMVNGFNSEAPLPNWASKSALQILPRAGKRLNASYNRRSLSFFYITGYYGRDIYTADSADIVCHELGHAVLDAYRPDLWGISSLEIWAFHEAFGDILSMLSVMQHDEVIDYVLKATGGDLKRQNIVSGVAEELGKVMRGHYHGLRSATNDYAYVTPDSLPKKGKPEDLLAEPHNFSRILSGAVYDVFVMMYEDLLASQPPKEAFKAARDILSRYVLKSIRFTPNTPRMFEGFAKTLLWVDFNEPSRPYHDRMWSIFLRRKLISESPVVAQAVSPAPVPTSYMLMVDEPKTIKLSDCVLSAQGAGGLFDLDLEVNRGDCTFYGPDGVLYDLTTSDEEVYAAASGLVSYLDERNLVGQDGKPFGISNGKLVRMHFACDCSGTCGPSKYQPEYYRKYKPANNAGCCGGCKTTKTEIVATKTIRRGCGIRYIVPR